MCIRLLHISINDYVVRVGCCACFCATYRDDEVCNSADELASHSYAFTGDDLQLDGNVRNQLENNENNNNNNNSNYVVS